MRCLNALSMAALIAMMPMSGAWAFTGTQLYELCSNKNPNSNENLGCAAYVHGFSDGFLLGTAFAPNTYCPPKHGYSIVQIRLIVEKYLRDHPEELNQEALDLVGDALMDAFRCKKSN